jgi:23S rRNA-/tRNA-specific pseudouridylate synthase
MRLDQAVAARFPELSRRKARELIAAGRVLVNQRPVRIASREIADAAELAIWSESTARPDLLAITDDWLAVDKPPGVPTQPTRDRSQLSLEESLRAEYKKIWLVHRLDTPTSGVVLFARTQPAAAALSRLFASGDMQKTYVAVCVPPLTEEKTIAAPLDGNEALTIARPLHDGLVELDIRTGRAHQIRIHLASIGHPVAGDRRYGGAPAPRLMLHAWKLQHHTLGEIIAPVPAEFPRG